MTVQTIDIPSTIAQYDELHSKLSDHECTSDAKWQMQHGSDIASFLWDVVVHISHKLHLNAKKS